jgi:hypothetical protein
VEVRNTRDVSVRIEILRNFDTSAWDLKRSNDDAGSFEKVDLDTVKFTIDLPPQSKKTFEYTLTSYRGVRAEDWTRRSRQ